MILTDKCKEDFKKWYFNVYCVNNGYGFLRFFAFKSFKEDTLSEQYGVYQDFFDSVDMNLSIDMNFDHEMIYTGWFDWSIIIDLDRTISGFVETRQEARIVMLKEANRRYNENK